MKRTKLALALSCSLALLLAPSFPARAQAPAGPTDANAVRMTLQECLKRGLENNLDLIVARKNPQISEQQVTVNDAIFDGNLTAGALYDRTSQDITINGSNVTPENLANTYAASVGWAQALRFGGSYSASLVGSYYGFGGVSYDARQGFLTSRDIADHNYPLRLHFEMPLLRGLGKEVNTANIIIAKTETEVSREQLRGQAIATLQAVENGYWNLLAAIEAARVARDSLKLAQDLYELNKKKVEVGTLAPIEITQAEAGVASRQEAVIVADTAVGNAEDALRRLLAVPKDDPFWRQHINPTDRPEYKDQSVDVDAAIAKALDARPEVISARKRFSEVELSERVAKNGVKHSLKLTADVNPTLDRQLADTRYLFPPDFYPPTFAESDSKFRDYALGLTYAYPIGNRAAKANYAIAQLNREKGEIAIQSIEQDVRVDVRAAARAVDSGVQRVAAARSNTVLQRKTVEAEQKKFENGMSTSFEVLRIQTDLFSAQLAEIQAVLDYVKSLADLERAKGTLLEAKGFQLDAATGK